MGNSLKKIGDLYHHFELIQIEPIDELSCTLKTLVHKPSGAQIIHIENDDPENVFCLAFRTLPENSNGVAHILEHTVLCGSKKFPVKDPFFSMSRRSLNTYMNALTAPDFTCYPAASMVEQDFYNLLEVYLDAVFHPELKELSFLQEGHRLEFAKPQDPHSELTYKGIVFNEMKGALSSPISRLWQEIMGSLFPHILYHHNFGGEPLEIPSLTYEQLLEFHKTYYQESRCNFYFYGNLPTEKHLDFLEKNTLKNAHKEPLIPANPIEKSFEKPIYIKANYPVSQNEDTDGKTYYAFSWLTTHLSNQKEVLALQVIDHILMGTDASLLKYNLLKSGLCQNVFSHFEDELSQIPYSIIFEGCKEQNEKQLKELLFKELQKLIEKPFDSKLVEAALHQLEFSKTEISGDYGPYGLYLLLKLVPLKNVGAPIERALKIHSLFDELKQDLQDELYLQKLIQRYFLNNPHFSSIEMSPDPLLGKKEKEKEQNQLSSIQKELSENQAQLIVEKAKELETFQKKQENQDLEVLPKVSLKDVAPHPQELDLGQKEMGSAQLYYHKGFTNQIAYLDVAQKLPQVSFEHLPYVRLFAYLLPQLGCNQRTYEDNLRLIQEKTGGISCFLDTCISCEDPSDFSPRLVLQGKSLHRNQEALLDILYDMLTTPNVEDVDRLKELLSLHFVELEQSLKNNPLKYATNLSYSTSSTQGYVNYFWYGLGYYELIKDLAKNFDQKKTELIKVLIQLKSQLLHGNSPDLISSSDEQILDQLCEIEFKNLSKLPEKDYRPFEKNYTPHQIQSRGIPTSSPVFFTSLSFKTDGFKDPQTPLLSIAAKLFDNTHLHQAIREQGGAYGGGSSNRMGIAKFGFYAYRDPNLSKTIEAFHHAVEKVSQGDFSNRELEEAKLGVIQKLDHPLLPEHKAYTGYIWNQEKKTYEFRQEVRDQILKATKEDIQKVVAEKIAPHMKTATLVTFSSKANLEKESTLLDKKGFGNLEIKSF